MRSLLKSPLFYGVIYVILYFIGYIVPVSYTHLDVYKRQEISYLLNGEEIKALINKTTKKNFFVKKHSHGQKESTLEFNTRQDIVFSGDYENLIKNSQYDQSSKDN